MIRHLISSACRFAKLTRGILAICCFAFVANFAQAQTVETLRLADIFSSNAVLQREKPCPVYGSDIPGTRITASFGNQQAHTVAGSTGAWRLTFAPMRASSEPATLIVRGSTTVTLTNILVGDVWLMTGQSNADFPLKSSFGAKDAISNATNKNIRCLHLPASDFNSADALAGKPAMEGIKRGWFVSAPAKVDEISAVGYLFALNIQKTCKIPIGLIDVSVGGTPALSWMPGDAIAASPRFQAIADHFLDSDMVAPFAKTRLLQNLSAWDHAGRAAPMPEHPYKPGACWRNGLASIAPFPLRGILWYQGETDADFYAPFDYDLMARWHTKIFSDLVSAWRKAWQDASLPVYFVQLPQMNRPSWPWFRESQLQCSVLISNTAMAVAYEYGNPSNVHPIHKQPVADRLALIARALTYGEQVEWSGPVLRNWRVNDHSIILDFDHTTGGLVARDARDLRLFQIAGPDRQFYPAIATISGGSVVVSSTNVPTPVAVRYCWCPVGDINFYNGVGLPASPFRTDHWFVTRRPVRVACIGDSITFGSGITNSAETYPAQLQALLGPDYEVRNFGKGGCTITRDACKVWCRGYMRQVEHTNALAFKPDIVICNLGINDVSSFADSCRKDLVRDYREIISAYRTLETAPRFILWHPLAPLFPGQRYYGKPVVSEVNNSIRQVVDLTGVDTLDMFAPLSQNSDWFPDHIHPNSKGAYSIAEATHKYFMEVLEPPIRRPARD